MGRAPQCGGGSSVGILLSRFGYSVVNPRIMSYSIPLRSTCVAGRRFTCLLEQNRQFINAFWRIQYQRLIIIVVAVKAHKCSSACIDRYNKHRIIKSYTAAQVWRIDSALCFYKNVGTPKSTISVPVWLAADAVFVFVNPAPS